MSHPADDRPEAVDPEPSSRQTSPPAAPEVPEASPSPSAAESPAPAPFAAAPVMPRRPPPKAPSNAPVWLAAAFVSLLWAFAPIAFALGYRQGKAPFDYDPFVLLILGAMAIGPAGLVWVAANLFVEGRRLRWESQRSARLAEEMVAPAVAAGIRTGEIVIGLQAEIARAGEAAATASRQLEGLRTALQVESEFLDVAARTARTAAEEMAAGLGRERERLEGLASGLDARTTAVTDAIARQARLVGEVSDLAETQLREAEASFTARSTGFTEAASRLAEAARAAAESLGQQAVRLEGAGSGLAEHVQSVETTLDTRRNALQAAAAALKTEQEGLAAQGEAHLARLAEVGGQARLSAADMRDSAIKGGEALSTLIQEAASQFQEFAAAARAERDEFGQSTRYALEAVARAAAEERQRLEAQTRGAIEALTQAAEQTRQAADRNAEAARAQVDQLAEAAFSAGQRANQVFETRLEEARSLIARSAQMVEEAGEATARRLEQGAATARRTLDELAGMLGRIEDRVASLPEKARSQAEQVREAVTESMDGLLDQARRTAQETQAIDAAFQERVRRNFDMLSEAVKMMGSVAVAGGAQTPPSAASATAPTRPVLSPSRPAPEPEDEAPRPRLRLTPAKGVSDETFSEIFEAAGGPPEALGGLRAEPPAAAPGRAVAAPAPGRTPPTGGGWTWRDLLSTVDDDGQRTGPDVASLDFLADEIRALGIDPTVLLPVTRVDELSTMISEGQGDLARETVRRLAPAATRKLSRRLLEEPRMRRSVMDFLARYQTEIETANGRDRSGREVGALLSTEAGRLYLLAEAAADDVV
ncbi:MAG: polar localization protein TipN [Alphaproteobacteria bacterium]